MLFNSLMRLESIFLIINKVEISSLIRIICLIMLVYIYFSM